MKIGIAQINTVAGDFPGNARRLLLAYRECLEGGAEWVVAPELVLSGYASVPSLAHKCLQALDYLSGEIKAVPLLLGHPDGNGSSVVSILVDGGLRATFQESAIFEWRGIRIGIQLGGDPLRLDSPSFILHPARCRYFEGFRLSFNPSPAPLVFCNAVGSNRSEIYPGYSSAWSSTGECLAALPGFRESCQVLDLAGPAINPLIHDDLSDLRNAAVLGIHDAVRKSSYLGATVHHDGSPGARILVSLAAAALGAAQVDAVSFSTIRPELSSGVPLHSLDPSALEATFSSLGAAADPQALESLLLSGFASERGHLLILPVTRTGILLGKAPPADGLTPFAELSAARVRDLADFLQLQAPATGPAAAEAIAHHYADEGLALEEIIALGYPEHEILKIIRQIDLARRTFRPAPIGLRLSP